jgi:C-terminal processing protease CtpA/Prc
LITRITRYWLRQRKPDASDLNEVGLTLKEKAGDYIVAAVATKNGKATVGGVQPGDKLIRVDGLETKRATWGGIYDALQGKPGETRVLVLGRGANQVTVNVTVTAF